MDSNLKFIKKLDNKNKDGLTNFIDKIVNGDMLNLDIKKLAGYKDIFRARLGDYRVIYKKDILGEVVIVRIENKNDNTYKF